MFYLFRPAAHRGLARTCLGRFRRKGTQRGSNVLRGLAGPDAPQVSCPSDSGSTSPRLSACHGKFQEVSIFREAFQPDRCPDADEGQTSLPLSTPPPARTARSAGWLASGAFGLVRITVGVVEDCRSIGLGLGSRRTLACQTGRMGKSRLRFVTRQNDALVT